MQRWDSGDPAVARTAVDGGDPPATACGGMMGPPVRFPRHWDRFGLGRRFPRLLEILATFLRSATLFGGRAGGTPALPDAAGPPGWNDDRGRRFYRRAIGWIQEGLDGKACESGPSSPRERMRLRALGEGYRERIDRHGNPVVIGSAGIAFGRSGIRIMRAASSGNLVGSRPMGTQSFANRLRAGVRWHKDGIHSRRGGRHDPS